MFNESMIGKSLVWVHGCCLSRLSCVTMCVFSGPFASLNHLMRPQLPHEASTWSLLKPPVNSLAIALAWVGDYPCAQSKPELSPMRQYSCAGTSVLTAIRDIWEQPQISNEACSFHIRGSRFRVQSGVRPA